MSDWLRDFQLAVRTLRKRPGFSATALLTIALGIGSTSAIFSVVNAVLLQPLPYKDSDRLVLLWQELRARHVKDFPFPVGDFPDVKARGTLFEDFAAVQTFRTSMSTDTSAPEQIRIANVTTNMFRVLGVPLYLGRDFQDSDGTPQQPPPQPPSAAPATGLVTSPSAPPPPQVPNSVILSYEFWRRHFGSDPTVVNRAVDLGQNGPSPVVVGVLAPGVQLLFPARTSVERAPDVWTAMRVDFANGSRNSGAIRVVGRMKPGVALAQAQAQMDGLAADLRRQYPVKANAGVYINVNSMHEDLVGAVRPSIVALMGAVTFVLLIACANVANLILARLASQSRDFAVRTALGAARSRLIRLLLTESLVLAGTGALAGLGLAALGIKLLLALGPSSLPRADLIRLDPVVVAFAAAAAIGSAVLFGLLPALRASRTTVSDVLRQGGRSSGLQAGGRMRGGVVIVEVALSFVLLVGSGLMLRSFVALQHVDPGFNADHVLTLSIPNFRATTPDAAKAYIDDVAARLRNLSGVTMVAAGQQAPLDGTLVANNPWAPESVGGDLSRFQQADSTGVRPGYFATMQTRVLAGREFTEADSAQGVRVVIIDTLLAAKAFGTQSPIGQHIQVRSGQPNADRFEVVGVVEHERWAALADDGREQIYFATGPFGARRWFVRTTGDPAALVTTARDAVSSIDRRVAIVDVQPMSVYVDRAQSATRFAFALIGVFAVLAALLAAVGLYGVLATLVRQRTAEIGVRMAFGAGRSSVFTLIVGHGLRLSAIGLALGLGAALLLTRLMQTSRLLVGVTATDPLTFVGMSALFVVIATAACSVPALRASRLDPLSALRAD